VPEKTYQEHDQEFLAHRAIDPDITFAQYFMKREALGVNAGGNHHSLGGNLRAKDGSTLSFWDAGSTKAEKLIRTASLRPSDRVIDFGCGSLRIGGHLIRYLDPGRYYGLDVIDDFYKIGADLIGRELLLEKSPRFGVINAESLADAERFGADVVYSFAVCVHVHPDELDAYLGALSRLCRKPGARLIFDLAVADVPLRYRTRSWARPLDLVLGSMRGLRCVRVSQGNSREEDGVRLTLTNVEFRRDDAVQIAEQPHFVRDESVPQSSGTGDDRCAEDERRLFDHHDAHPAVTHAQRHVERVAEQVKRGSRHHSLGENLTRGAFWDVGAAKAANYMRLASVSRRSKVIEYGCGSLRIGAHFIRALDPGCFLGLDVTDEFYEIGKRLVGDALLAEKRPAFAVISDAAIAGAAGFGADLVYSNAVCYQVHPDELKTYFDNLMRLAHRPGAQLVFNCMVADREVQYGHRSWARPLDAYKRALGDFDLVEFKPSRRTVKAGCAITPTVLRFRRGGRTMRDRLRGARSFLRSKFSRT
jgi:SAM-dependent methyltransferase